MTIHLRNLDEKDAPFMLEWMHDPTINCFFRFDASNASLEDCQAFIRSSNDDKNSRHFAIVDENDEYLGTISLKNITDKDAEYAISMRKKAHGTGAALDATEQILSYAYSTLKLEKVYLNVLKRNERANAFYKKAGFEFWHLERNAIVIKGEVEDLNWYYKNKDL